MAGGAEETRDNNESQAAPSADEGGGRAGANIAAGDRISEFKNSLFGEAKEHHFSRITEAITPLTIVSTSFNCVEDIHAVVPDLEEAGIKIYHPPPSATLDDKPYPSICEPLFAFGNKKLSDDSTWTVSSVWATTIPTNLDQPHQMMTLRCKGTERYPDGQTFTVCHNPSILIGSHPLLNPSNGPDPIHALTRMGYIKGLPASFRPNKDRAALYQSLTACLSNNNSILDPRAFDFISIKSSTSTTATTYICIRLDPSAESPVGKALLQCTNNPKQPWMYKGHRLSIVPSKSAKCERSKVLDDTIFKAYVEGKKGLIIRLSEIADHHDQSSLTTKLRQTLKCEGLSVLHLHKNQWGNQDHNGKSAIIQFNNSADCYYANLDLKRLSEDRSLFMQPNPSCTIPRVDRPSTRPISLPRIICRHFGIGRITRTEVVSPILDEIINKKQSSTTPPPGSLPQRGQPSRRTPLNSTPNPSSYASVVTPPPSSKATNDRITQLEQLVKKLEFRLAAAEDTNKRLAMDNNKRLANVEAAIERMSKNLSDSFKLITQSLGISLQSQLPADTASAKDIENMNTDDEEKAVQHNMELSPNSSGTRKRNERSPPSAGRQHKRGTSDGSLTTASVGGSLPPLLPDVGAVPPSGDPPNNHD